MIQVPSSRAVEVDGYRVDDVEDHKIVEVEEYQEFELKPVATGNAILTKTTDVGRVNASQTGHLSRRMGNEVYARGNSSVRAIDEDSNPDNSAQGQRSQGYVMPFMQNKTQTAFERNAPAGLAPGGMMLEDPCDTMAAQNRYASSGPSRADVKLEPGQLGLVVMNTHTRHTDGNGVVVTKINRGGAAEAAGLLVNDVISCVHNFNVSISFFSFFFALSLIPFTTSLYTSIFFFSRLFPQCQTVADFRNAVARVPGPLSLTVNRDGRRNVKITLYRNAA